MNKKERRKALFSVLSSKFKNNQLLIVDDIKLKEIKTKLAESVFSAFPYEKKILLAMPEKNEVLQKASSNLQYVKTILVDYLNISDLLKYDTLILLKKSLDNLDYLTK